MTPNMSSTGTSANGSGTTSADVASTAATASSPPAPRRNSTGPPAGTAIGPNCFRFGEELGRGSFSVVRQATLISNSTTYAIKILDKHHLRQHKKERYATVEVEALKRLSAPSAASSPKLPVLGNGRPAMPRKKSGQPMMPNSPSDRTIRASASPGRGSLEGAGLMERQQEAAPRPRPKPKAGHPGVVKLTWAFQDMSNLCAWPLSHISSRAFADLGAADFVLDLAPNGEILSLIRQVGSFSLTCARHYAAELVDIVGWVHSRGVLHRDLKPENILLDSEFHMRLTDFGSAKVLPIVDGKVVRELAVPSTPGVTVDVLPGSHASRLPPKRSFVGTAEYVSPEVLLSEPAAEPADFWALGCILYQFITGSPPFRGKTEYLTFQKIKALEYTFPDGFDSQARDLVERLLVLDPSKRIGAGPTGIEEIRSHAFFAGVDFTRLFTRPPPKLESGLVGPPAPAVQRDLFAELGLDDVNETSEDEPDDGMTPAAPVAPPLPEESLPSDEEDFEPPKGRWAHKSKHGGGKGGSVSSGTASIGTIGTLDPSSAVAQAIVGLGKGRPPSINTSISSGQTGEPHSPYSPIQAQQPPGASGQNEQERHVSAPWTSPTGKSSRRCVTASDQVARVSFAVADRHRSRRSLPLLPDEKVLYSTAILVPSSPLIVKTLNPLSRLARERFLILTDFPRLLCVKQDPKGDGSFKLKYECLIVRRGTGSGIGGGSAGGANVLKSVKEKGSKGISIHTVRCVFFCAERHSVVSC